MKVSLGAEVSHPPDHLHPPAARGGVLTLALYWNFLLFQTLLLCVCLALHCSGLFTLLHWVSSVGKAGKCMESILEKRVVR